MRTFFTFLSLFTLLFFLCPLLCLPAPLPEPDRPAGARIVLPETVSLNGTEIPLADLLVGRLAALDVKHYSDEALRAVAIALTSRLAAEGSAGTEGWEILTPDKAKTLWGDLRFAAAWPRLQKAVESTWGQVLLRDGAPVPAKIFPLSWGTTADGVACPYDFTADGFETEEIRTAEEIRRVFPEFSGSLTVKKAQNGRVETVTSGEFVLDGKDFARALELPSLCFSVLPEQSRTVFLCRGQGDGEGMSLYGANELAKRGAPAEEILTTFYPGTVLTE